MLSSHHLTNKLLKYKRNPYPQLFTYIKNNKTLTQHNLAKIKTDHKTAVNDLLQAIEIGDHQHIIFTDPSCHLYLLNLIQTKQIAFNQGMTVYAYLLALMQFTDRQPLRNEDADVKFIRPITIERIAENSTFTAKGQTYLNDVTRKFGELGYDINLAKLKQLVLSLPPTEQWLIKLTTYTNDQSHGQNDCDRVAFILATNTAFIELIIDKKTHTSWIPSTTLINYFLKIMTTNPMQMQHCFGSINEATLYSLHIKNRHPIPLYSTAVKSNLRLADNWRCGPFLIWLHDMGHLFWANLFTAKQRNQLLTLYIPELSKLHTLALAQNDKIVAAKIQEFIYKANAFDLSGVEYYKAPEDRFNQYLLSTIGTIGEKRKKGIWNFYPSTEQGSLGTIEDRIYFLMLTVRNHPTTTQASRKIWDSILTCDNNTLEGDIAINRPSSITSALARLANDTSEWRLKRYQREKWLSKIFVDVKIFRHHNINHQTDSDKIIDWQQWYTLIAQFENQPINSEKLWETIQQDPTLGEQLLMLICQHNIQYFHPYIPMTCKKLSELKTLIIKNLSVQNDLETPAITIKCKL